MNQVIVSLLNTLGLRSDPQTTVVLRNTVEAVTQEQLKDFTGDVGIDGTLNIDFTDTLDFFNGPIDRASDPAISARNIGDFIGYSVIDTDFEALSGAFEGIFDVFGGALEIPMKGFVNQLLDTDTDVFLGQGVFELDATPIGGSVYFQASTSVSDANGSLSISTSAKRDGTGKAISIEKETATDLVMLRIDDSQVGFRVSCELDDVDDTYWKFQSDENESADVQLGFTGKDMYSETLLDKGFADDAAAGVGGIPVGGFYHTAGTLKIRLAPE